MPLPPPSVSVLLSQRHLARQYTMPTNKTTKKALANIQRRICVKEESFELSIGGKGSSSRGLRVVELARFP